VIHRIRARELIPGHFFTGRSAQASAGIPLEIDKMKKINTPPRMTPSEVQPVPEREQVEDTPYEAVASICSVLVVGLFILTFLAQNYVIPSGSMENTLLVGDHFFGDVIIELARSVRRAVRRNTASEWKVTDGTIQRFTITDGFRPFPVLEYSYEVNGEREVGSTTSFSVSNDEINRIGDVVDGLPGLRVRYYRAEPDKRSSVQIWRQTARSSEKLAAVGLEEFCGL
jgi:hypothetical protein